MTELYKQFLPKFLSQNTYAVFLPLHDVVACLSMHLYSFQSFCCTLRNRRLQPVVPAGPGLPTCPGDVVAAAAARNHAPRSPSLFGMVGYIVE